MENNKTNPFEEKFPGVASLVEQINELLSKIPVCDEITLSLTEKEISKPIIVYDLAYLPKGKTLEDVMRLLVSDGIVVTNSDENGNVSASSTNHSGIQLGGEFPIKQKNIRLLLTIDLSKKEGK